MKYLWFFKTTRRDSRLKRTTKARNVMEKSSDEILYVREDEKSFNVVF